jgi:IS1 family transposase
MKTATQTPVHGPASTCVTPAFFRSANDQNTWLWAWDALSGRLIEILCGDHHQKCQLVIWNGG